MTDKLKALFAERKKKSPLSVTVARQNAKTPKRQNAKALRKLNPSLG